MEEWKSKKKRKNVRNPSVIDMGTIATWCLQLYSWIVVVDVGIMWNNNKEWAFLYRRIYRINVYS